MSRVVIPETTRLDLSRGDWLIVKKRLNAGENRAMRKRGLNADGVVDRFEAGVATVLAYLLDWSFTDPSGKPLAIRDKTSRDIEDAVDALDPESYTEILRAIEAHETRQQQEREAEKNAQAGETNTAGISPSPSGPAGHSTRSEALTQTSTTS